MQGDDFGLEELLDEDKSSSSEASTGADDVSGTGEDVSASPADGSQETQPRDEPKEPVTVPYGALKGERERYQQRIAEMQAQHKAEIERMMQLARSPSGKASEKAKPEVPDFYEDPEAVVTSLRQELLSLKQQQAEALRQQQEQQQLNIRIQRQGMAARQRYQDFDQVRMKFEAVAADDPSLAEKAIAMVRNGEDAAEYVYRVGRHLMRLDGASDLDEYEQKLRAKWEAEMRGQSPQDVVPTQPPSTAGVASARGKARPPATQQEQLERLFPNF